MQVGVECTMIIQRHALPMVQQALRRQAAVALIGPRQVGKTTLAHEIKAEQNALYLDLESRADRNKLADPELFLSAYANQLVILDEIHRTPEIFPELRGLIDQGRRQGHRTGRFLILGSASMVLLRQSRESLAGRIENIHIHPFDVLEITTPGLAIPSRIPARFTAGSGVRCLWVRGGFPDSFLAANDTDSWIFRQNFIHTYLERDVPQWGFRIPAARLERLWTMLAHNQGALLNATKLAASLDVSPPTVSLYIDLLVDLLLVRRLPPLHANTKKRLIKSPKVYIRDSGLVHALLGLKDYNGLAGHPVVGSSWEGFVVENLLAVAPPQTRPSFYRTVAGAEIDLVLEMPGQHKVWAIEIRHSLTPRLQKGFHHARADLAPARSFIVYAGEARYPITEDVEVIGVRELAAVLQALWMPEGGKAGGQGT